MHTTKHVFLHVYINDEASGRIEIRVAQHHEDYILDLFSESYIDDETGGYVPWTFESAEKRDPGEIVINDFKSSRCVSIHGQFYDPEKYLENSNHNYVFAMNDVDGSLSFIRSFERDHTVLGVVTTGSDLIDLIDVACANLTEDTEDEICVLDSGEIVTEKPKSEKPRSAKKKKPRTSAEFLANIRGRPNEDRMRRDVQTPMRGLDTPLRNFVKNTPTRSVLPNFNFAAVPPPRRLTASNLKLLSPIYLVPPSQLASSLLVNSPELPLCDQEPEPGEIRVLKRQRVENPSEEDSGASGPRPKNPTTRRDADRDLDDNGNEEPPAEP